MSLKPPYLPKPLADLEVVFAANTADLMPAMADIPEEFRCGSPHHPWIKFQQQWFFRGLAGVTITAKDGIDKAAALRHLTAIQRSWDPKHEHKEAAVAYLASLWLEVSGVR